MDFYGEMAAISVAFSWAFASLFFEYSSKRIGSVVVNFFKLALTIFLIGALLWFVTGSALPLYANSEAWFWLSLSGVVGFAICDLCLFYAYVTITSRFTQLIMTTYPPFAALTAWVLMGEKMPLMGYVGMAVTMSGVAMSIFKKDSENKKFKLNLPLKGVVCAFIAAFCQGVGLALSKQGMIHYSNAEGITEEAADMIPFAATQIRCFTGILGFFLILFFTKKLFMVKDAVNNKKGMAFMFGGTIFGPFIGVSLSLYAISKINTGIATTIIATTPILLLIFDALLKKKKVYANEVIGTILSVLGVSLFFL